MTSSGQSAASQYVPISALEARHYYHGLYAKPVLVARTGTDRWEPPTGPEAYLTRKVLSVVGNHPLAAIWQGEIATQIHDILDGMEVDWTSTDVARIGFVAEATPPVIIWIGVRPATLSSEKGHEVVMACKEVLMAHEIRDVEVEIRESLVTRFIGPKLRESGWDDEPNAGLLEPLTATLGLSICNTHTPYAEGTGGFYVTDRNERLYLVTARHVVLASDATNKIFKRKFSSEPREPIALFGTAALNNYVQRIKDTIQPKEITLEQEERFLPRFVGGYRGLDADTVAQKRQDAQKLILDLKKAIAAHKELLNEVEHRWRNIDNRILGHLVFSPPVSYGTHPTGYTQDYALIEIDRTKIDSTSFMGNAIDLGTDMTSGDFTKLMFPNWTNSHSFRYPGDRLLRIQGILSDDDICNPPITDQDGDKCHVVIKRGSATGLTIGRANTIASYSRQDGHGGVARSMEWAIFNYDEKRAPFSERGDSGAGIFDCHGHLGGLLTGGDGITDRSDVTYATPISFILQGLWDNGYMVTINVPATAKLYPV